MQKVFEIPTMKDFTLENYFWKSVYYLSKHSSYLSDQNVALVFYVDLYILTIYLNLYTCTFVNISGAL